MTFVMAHQKNTVEADQFPHNHMPLSDPERTFLLNAVGVYCRGSDMPLCDSVKFGEMYTLRIGFDDEWLLNLAHRNGLSQFIETMMQARKLPTPALAIAEYSHDPTTCWWCQHPQAANEISAVFGPAPNGHGL